MASRSAVSTLRPPETGPLFILSMTKVTDDAVGTLVGTIIIWLADLKTFGERRVGLVVVVDLNTAINREVACLTA
jgi:hypothetical protein